MKEKNVLTTGDVARICNVVPETVAKWFDSGLLKGYKLPDSKDRRILPEDFIEFLKEHNFRKKRITKKGNKVLTVGDVARICNVVSRTVVKWFDSGLLKGYKLPGSKDRRILPEDFIEFLKEHNMPYVEAVLEEFS